MQCEATGRRDYAAKSNPVGSRFAIPNRFESIIPSYAFTVLVPHTRRSKTNVTRLARSPATTTTLSPSLQCYVTLTLEQRRQHSRYHKIFNRARLTMSFAAKIKLLQSNNRGRASRLPATTARLFSAYKISGFPVALPGLIYTIRWIHTFSAPMRHCFNIDLPSQHLLQTEYTVFAERTTYPVALAHGPPCELQAHKMKMKMINSGT